MLAANLAFSHFFLQFFVCFLLQINKIDGQFSIQASNFSFQSFFTENRICGNIYLPLIFVDSKRMKVFSPEGFSFEAQAFENTSGIYEHVFSQSFKPLSFSLDLMKFAIGMRHDWVDDNSEYYLRYYIFLDSKTESLRLVSSNFLKLIPKDGIFQDCKIINSYYLEYQIKAVFYNYVSALEAILRSNSKTRAYGAAPWNEWPSELR